MKYFYSAYVYEDCGLNCPSPVVALEVGMGGGGGAEWGSSYVLSSKSNATELYVQRFSIFTTNQPI